MNELKPWKITIRAVIGLMCLFVAGCAIDQKKEIATYRKVIDDNKPAAVQIAPDRVVTLTDALKLAVQNEEQLSLQGENYLQALLTKDKTFANFLPNVSLSADWSYTHEGSLGYINGTSVSSPQQTTVTVPGQWNLFNGFRDYYGLKSADQSIEQQKQLIFDVKQTVLLDVAQAYYQVLTSEQSVDVLSNSLTAQQANVKTLEEEYHVGAARRLDVAQAESEASATRVTLLQSQADVRTGRAMLAYLVDAPILNNPLRDDFNPPAKVPALDQWIAVAEAGRQDLIAADAAVRAARYNVEIAFGQYYPTLGLNTTNGLLEPPYQAGTFWNALFNFNIPIFTGGLIRAEVRQAWSQFRSAALTQEQLKRDIDQNIRVAYVDLGLAHDELAELQTEVLASRDEYYLAEMLYKNGGGTYLNVLQAQATLVSTQLQLTTEQFAQKTAYFNLLRTAGELSYASVTSTTRPSEKAITQLATQPVTQPSSRP
ncbi:MAG TPA: TolC family protein [Tepidisphaeraceae bacterium]|jgi:outer membrane protein|nr:TolC family protein [Tepidisphaeraceae bacterium]